MPPASTDSNPRAAGEVAHTLLPCYKVGCDDSLSQKVDAEGVILWREIARFHSQERAQEILRACNSHAAMRAALEKIHANAAEGPEWIRNITSAALLSASL